MNLFNPQFLLFLALLLLVAGLLLFYMDMKMREQNHKIKAIADLATTIAQSIKGGGGNNTNNNNTNNNNNNNKESTKENIELITVSDDDDSSSDDDGSSDDEDDGDDKVNLKVKVKIEQEEPLKLNIIKLSQEEEQVSAALEESKSALILPESQEESESALTLPETQEESQEATTSSDLDGFKIVLSSDLDYKKMTITKLRQIVTEKGLIPSSDASKMKKPELLKLLEAE